MTSPPSPDLPLELIDEVIYACRDDLFTLYDLSLVSRRCASQTRQHIFRKIDTTLSDEDHAAARPHFRKFTALLENNRALGRHVLEFSITRGELDLSRFFPVLKALSGLRRLRLKSIRLSHTRFGGPKSVPSPYAARARFKKLDSLQLDSVVGIGSNEPLALVMLWQSIDSLEITSLICNNAQVQPLSLPGHANDVADTLRRTVKSFTFSLQAIMFETQSLSVDFLLGFSRLVDFTSMENLKFTLFMCTLTEPSPVALGKIAAMAKPNVRNMEFVVHSVPGEGDVFLQPCKSRIKLTVELDVGGAVPPPLTTAVFDLSRCRNLENVSFELWCHGGDDQVCWPDTFNLLQPLAHSASLENIHVTLVVGRRSGPFARQEKILQIFSDPRWQTLAAVLYGGAPGRDRRLRLSVMERQGWVLEDATKVAIQEALRRIGISQYQLDVALLPNLPLDI